MMLSFVFDIETMSAADLTKVGSYLYARDATTDIRCVSFCVVADGVRGSIETWAPGDPVPQAVTDFAADPNGIAIAYNDAFDRQIWEQILTRYGWPTIALERHRCAQAAVLARALPASLDAAAAALKIGTQKSKAGMAAMKKLSRPRRLSAAERKAGMMPDFKASPEDLTALADYNRCDVQMTMEIIDRIGLLGDAEQALWLLDQQINERGVHVDVELIEAALRVGADAQAWLNGEIAELTDSAATKPGQRDRILKWLAARGCKISNLRKGTVADALLEPGLDPAARRMLQLRQDGAGVATSKFETLRRWTSSDGELRIRYAYRFHGSSAGRFTSMGVQLHNLRKPEITNVQEAISAVATGSLAEMHRHGFDRPLETIGHITRATITAAPGKRLFIADLSGIEARGAAYIVGDAAELEQWRTFDRTGKPEDEPYYRTGITTFGQPPATARKTGKTGALAFQYQGAVGAYRRITGDRETSDEALVERCRAWRNDHPKHQAFWGLSVIQAVQAIRHPGKEFAVKGVSFHYDQDSGFLEMTLPSGRRLAYPAAMLFEDEARDTMTFSFLDASGSRAGRMYHERKGAGAFGGLLLENATQAACRDIFVEVMPRLEAAGYPIVMHTHDEYVCETPEDFGSLDEFLAIITAPPRWAPDLPIAAKARISGRLIEIPESKPAVESNAIDNAATGEDEEEGDGRDDGDVVDREDGVAGRDVVDREDGVDETDVVDPPAELMLPDSGIPFMVTNSMKAQLRGLGHLDEAIFTMTPAAAVEILGAAGLLNGAAAAAQPEEQPQVNGPAGNGHAANGFDHGRPPGDTRTDYTDRSAEQQAGKPYGPVRAVLLFKRYRLTRTFPFVLPGETEPLFWEDRYELQPGEHPTEERPRKTCRFWHRVNGQELCDTGPRRIIYHWPAIMRAGPDAWVYIVEGANKADPLIAAGLLATAAPYHQWGKECVEALAGRHLVYLEDHDHPDAKGRIQAKKFSAEAEKHLAPVAASFRIVPALRLWQNLRRAGEPPHGWDVKDWIEQGGNIADLVDISRRESASCQLQSVCAADVAMEAVEWLWPNRFARGKVGILAGLPDEGKGLVLSHIAAQVTTGGAWPCCEGRSPQGRVLLLSAEDAPGDTVVPRLAAAGADLSRIDILTMVREGGKERMFSLQTDLEMLRQKIVAAGDVVLVEIDPISAYFGVGKVDSYRTTDVRAVLAPLVALAEELRIAVIGIMHFNKKIDVTNALLRISDSMAFGATARHVYGIVSDPDHQRQLMVRAKNNLANRGCDKALAFSFNSREVGVDHKNGRPITAPFIVFEPEHVEVTATEAMQGANDSKSPGTRNTAKQFLAALLSNGPVGSTEVYDAAEANNISKRTLHRAKSDIGAEIAKDGPMKDGERTWQWRMTSQKGG
jgi:DNA polymerase